MEVAIRIRIPRSKYTCMYLALISLDIESIPKRFKKCLYSESFL